MKNLYTVFTVLSVLLSFNVSAQQNKIQNEKCLANYYYMEMLAKDPVFRANQQQFEVETQAIINSKQLNNLTVGQKSAAVVRVIPVVFHVIHEGGSENISRTQIVDQIDSLNVDYRRLNADAVNTPIPFQGIGGDAEIEFRLATLDPNGNCTDGVVRVESALTNDARDNVKALSYWPSNKYLNIWVVKTIENTSGASGTILGFAQFPGGLPTTDGVVMRSDVVGSIGTASNTWNSNGRTATHEIGHWLNLRHIWGDANCGSDFVADTPTQQGPNAGCPAFPHVTCNNGPDGDMFSNYMDYSDGTCENIFSMGQCSRMNAALSSSTSGRNNLWSSANLIATGTTGTPGALCAPIAAFVNNIHYICEGEILSFADGSWNGTPDTWNWTFPGGTPSSSSLQNPVIQYNTAGTYDISLTVSNASGSDSHTLPGTVIVVPAVGQNTVPYSEGFETISFPGTDWPIDNGGGNTWTQTGVTSHSGLSSIYINNYTGNTTQTTDVFLTPTFNLTNVTSSNLTFWLADAIRSSSSTDQLKVFASTSCGQLWNLRYNKTGAALSTAGLVSSNFVPTASQWRQETVNISSSSYNNKPNVRFKFEYLQGNGNNIYIDDINLDGTVGFNEVLEASLAMSVYPNPVINQATVTFTLTDKNAVIIDVVDVLGRVVNQISEATLEAGEYQFDLPSNLSSGLYSVRLNVNGFITSRKVIIK